MKQHELVDTYINSFTGETKTRLEKIRRIVHELAPDSIEDFAYGLPAYKLNGKPLIYFGGFARHIGFYATPNGHQAFRQEFSKYKQGKGSVQFPHAEPLPETLIRAVIEFRMQTVKES